MAAATNIEWAHSTWSPWIGCTKVGPGCERCYAEALDKRHWGGAHWGADAPRRQMSDDYWRQPLRWQAQVQGQAVRRRVFPSLCDPFDNAVPDAWRERFWDLIEATPDLSWLLVTKRIGNVATYMRWRQPRHNVWLIATVCDQAEYVRDVPKLLAAPAGVRGISVEPMLGPISIDAVDYADTDLDWVICGGESGAGARPMDPAWVRDLRDQCGERRIPFFFKQWGEWAPYDRGRGGAAIDAPVQRFGKKLAGRMLDGRTWDELPGHYVGRTLSQRRELLDQHRGLL